jgi:hypothetical protein
LGFVVTCSMNVIAIAMPQGWTSGVWPALATMP